MKGFYTLINGVANPLNLKKTSHKCDVLTALSASNDDEFFLVKSKKVKKKHQTEWEFRFLLDAFPTSSLRIRLEGELLSSFGEDREIQVRFYDYSKGKWGKSINKTISDGIPFGLGFTITDNLFDHIKTPKGWVRCNVKVRNVTPSAKNNSFDLQVDRARIVVD